ncbi:MAG TPA: S8 family serine peptidase [Chthoniobacterales bacterium]|nr:S8 family serine peptidase [Chthoniobacterales bacterium]
MKIHSLARWSLFLITAFWVAVIASSPGSSAREQIAPQNKIAPWIVEKTANGQEAEFLVVLRDQADLSGAKALRSKEDKSRFVRDALWQKAQQAQAPLLSWLSARQIEHRAYYIVNMIWVKGNATLAAELAARPDVVRLEGNPAIRNYPEELPVTDETSAPNIPEAVEPGIAYTHAPQVWASGFTGQGIVVAGADTGYRWDHNALKNKYRGWDGATASHDYNWHDSIHTGGGSCGPNSAAPCDDHGHGTHTIGTAIGDDGGTNQIGMAPGAKWIGCRNMDQGVGTPARYIECMEFFLAPYPVGGTPAQGDASKAPDVTTNSWGCPASEGCSATSLQAAVEAQRAAGIMMVVAAGNSGSSCSTVSDPPSFYDAAYSIGALNTGSDTIASFSSRGPVTADGSMRLKPDISAPGTNTRSASRTSVSSYVNLSGTSMATPHVAGAIALLWSAQPSLRHDIAATEAVLNETAAHVLSNICDGGNPLASPNNTYGYGRMDVKAAVDKLTLLSAVSRKVHGSAGTFDIPLPLSGEPGVECRSAAFHTVVFTFNNPVVSGSASVTSGTGSAAAPSFSGNTMTVALNGVTDVQKITVTLSGVTGSVGQVLPATSVSMNMLVGDTNGNKTVNSSDIGEVKAASGAPLDQTNFHADVVVSGSINTTDISMVKSRTNSSLP